MRHAIIDKATGQCVNVVEWDGRSEWAPPDGTEAVELSVDQGSVGVGWIRSGDTFVPPTVDEAKAALEQTAASTVVALSTQVVIGLLLPILRDVAALSGKAPPTEDELKTQALDVCREKLGLAVDAVIKP